MRLSFSQKINAVVSGLREWRGLKSYLIRRYWSRIGTWELAQDGLRASFYADDVYSNHWFYGPQDIGDVYEPAVTRLIARLAMKSTAFLDIGANLGYFSVVAGVANPDLRILAMEMDQTLRPILRANLDRNGLNAAEICIGAVGQGEGVVRYGPHPYSFLGYAGSAGLKMPVIELEAPVHEIDSVLAEKDMAPDLVKMDVDGAELFALRAASGMLANPALVLVLELHPCILPDHGHDCQMVADLLMAQGFTLYELDAFRQSADCAFHPVTDVSSYDREDGHLIVATRRPLDFLQA